MTQQDEIIKIEREIESLKSRISTLKRQQDVCNHRFSQPTSNPEKYKEEIVTGYSTHGVHIDAKTTFVDKTKNRWTRKCSLCGKEQHTYDNPNPKPELNWK